MGAGGSQSGLRWGLSHLQTEMLAILGFPMAFCNGGDVCLGCEFGQDVEGLMGPIMESPFPFSLLPRLFLPSVPIHRHCLGCRNNTDRREERSLPDRFSWEEAKNAKERPGAGAGS